MILFTINNYANEKAEAQKVHKNVDQFIQLIYFLP